MEEDTGKLTHADIKGEKVSLIDFNRSGVPLVEIVTEPDFSEASEVVEYLKKLQQIVRFLQVSNADMEKGDMRLEPNISLRHEGQTELPNYKVEVKNINSFRFVEKAIYYEIKRQAQLLDAGETPPQETRGFNEAKNTTVLQRNKENAHDYRYFPEPDIPPIVFSDEEIEDLRKQLPELPNAKQHRFQKEYELSAYDAEILTREIDVADYFEVAVTIGKTDKITPKQLANMIINKKVDISVTVPASLVALVKQETAFESVEDDELTQIIEEVLTEQEKAVSEYKSGKETVIMFLLGQVMKKLGKKVNVQMIKEKIEKELKR
jgi:aspartyl-tRNA(Asn)/glutamyl-tRNA(Gln) amidotransferase subunit B